MDEMVSAGFTSAGLSTLAILRAFLNSNRACGYIPELSIREQKIGLSTLLFHFCPFPYSANGCFVLRNRHNN